MPDPTGPYHVVECLFAGRLRYFREIELVAASREALIHDLIAGEFDHPTRVIAFDVDEGWARDVSADVATDLAIAAGRDHAVLTLAVRDFCERHGARLPQAA